MGIVLCSEPGPLLVGGRLRGYVLRRDRPRRPSGAACLSRHLYFTRLHLGWLPSARSMLWSGRVCCRVSLKMKVSADQVDHGANSHLPTISQTLAFLFLILHQKTPFLICGPGKQFFYQTGSYVCNQQE